MNTNNISDFDDIGAAIREGRALHPARAYRFKLAKDGLDFHQVEVDDPVPLGRQILRAGSLDPRDGFSLFAILETGDFEDVRLDEPFDLRNQGAERFVAFQTDRVFKLTINEAQVSWGTPAISGRALLSLANAGPGEVIYLEVRGGEDREIAQDELVDLTTPGTERFISAPPRPRSYMIVVNGREIEVHERRQTFQQLVELAYPGEPPAPNTVYTITFRHVASKPHSGELGAGGFVDVKNGSIFNVGRTVQS